MPDTTDPGDSWTDHYRGYRLHTNPDREVWWQVYDGTDRLYLDPAPDELVDRLLDLKYLGGRVRVTEGNDVLTRIEDGKEYETVWVGSLEFDGQLVPRDAPEFAVPLHPTDVETGELWPSVYDGSKYSFSGGADRIWWSNSDTHKRHPVESDLPDAVRSALARYKPRGGSFRVTPWDDVLTLVDVDRLSDDELETFDDLPRVVKNVIRLRNERGVTKLPIYVGEVDQTPIRVRDPPSLTDPVATGDLDLDDWVESLGETTEFDPDAHRIPDDDPTDW